MNKDKCITLLQQYITSWLTKDKQLFLDTLADPIDIRECYGASYSTKTQAEAWFTEWNKRGSVLDWNILDTFFDAQRNILFATWEFNHCYPDVSETRFDGITIMAAHDGKITFLHEYETKHKRFYPYK